MRIFTTILALIGAAVMLLSGVMKIVNSGFRSDMNSVYEIGGSEFGTWFYLLVGLFEILIAVLLFLPRFRTLGGIDLFIVMVGAIIFNVFFIKDVIPEGIDDPGGFIIAINAVLALLGLAIALLWRSHTSDNPHVLTHLPSDIVEAV